MSRIGVFCLPVNSHLNLFLALSGSLRAHGHQIVYFSISDLEARIRAEGFEFHLMEPPGIPKGTIGRMLQQLGAMGNLQSMRLVGQIDRLRCDGILQLGRQAIEAERLDALIVDQAEAGGGSLADALKLPWVSVCSGLALNREAGVPPFFTSWTYRDTRWAAIRNELAYRTMLFLARPISHLINSYRVRWGLRPYERMDDSFSPFAQIAQQVPEFDFPRRQLPPSFHYVGPIRRPVPPMKDFPWDRLDGRPLVYASLGTLVNRHGWIFHKIAEACQDLKVQLLLALGGGSLEGSGDLPGHPWVVPFAPQYELLGRAALTITHSGLNTALESLSHGVPMVAIPLTFEQPAIGARIAWTHTGLMLSSRSLSARRLKEAIGQVLNDASYHEAAARIQQAIGKTQGLESATDIVEKVVLSGKPVTRN